MAFFPKKVKHRKWQTGRKNPEKLLRHETRGVTVAFGSFGIKTTEHARITSNQLEAARRAMSRHLGKFGRAWVRIFPDRPFTKKPAEVKMGKGKGDPQGYCLDVRPGRVLFEVDGVSEVRAVAALKVAGYKLPVQTKVIVKK